MYRIHDGYNPQPLMKNVSEEACIALIASWDVIVNVSERTTIGGEQCVNIWWRWNDEKEETHTRFFRQA